MQPTEIDLKELIAILRRQSRLILITCVLVVIPALTYLVLATPLYRATALISIEAGGSNLLDPGSVENSQSAILNSRVDGEVEVLRAAATVLAVVESADLINDPEFGPSLSTMDRVAIALGVEGLSDRIRRSIGLRVAEPPTRNQLVGRLINRLQEATDIRRRGLTYLISVSVMSEDPQRAAEIANTYVTTYIERQILAKAESVIAARDVLRGQVEIAQAELARLEDALNNFIDDNLARLEEESNSATIAGLRQQLESAQSGRLETLEAITASREAAANNDWMTAAATLGDTALEQLARERETLERRLRGQVSGTQAQIDLEEALASLEQDLEQRLLVVQGSIETDLDAVTEAETLAREELREALLQSDMSSAVMADLFNLQQSATVARNQYQQLLTRVQELNALANVQISDARVVSEALPPTSAASPNKRLILALALTAAIGLGVLVAFLNEYYIGGVTSKAQLANVITGRVPVSVPALPAGGETQMFADEIVTSPLSNYSESFRKLRLAIDNNLHHSASVAGAPVTGGRNGRVILICSALPGEGKTTSAIALARTYALSGRKTILIDCDLRKPSVGPYIGDHTQEGLRDYLVATRTSPDATLRPVREQMSSLVVVTAGTRSTEPTDQMLNSQGFVTLLSAVRENFDVIILDSPPLLPVVDARYLAQSADIAVLVVRFATTTQGEVREAASQVQEFLRPDATMIGLLSHQMQRRGRRGYYNGAYAEYYGDGKA